MRILSVCIAVMLGATPAMAQLSYTNIGGYRAIQLNDAIFEVIPQGLSATGRYWCTASRFARIRLNENWRDRIYVARGYGPSLTTGRKTAIQFTTDPEKAGIKPLQNGSVVSGFVVGDSMSVQQADQYCNDFEFTY